MQPSDCRKHWLLVEYLLHKLSVAEYNYDATNREFVAIVSGLKRWRHYLLGTHIVVSEVIMQACGICRHSQTCLAGKLVFWISCRNLTLAVMHMLGKSNVVADELFM